MPDGYTRELVPLEDGTWYWHLFLDGEKVNGGLAEDEDWAFVQSCRYAWQHSHDEDHHQIAYGFLDFETSVAMFRWMQDHKGNTDMFESLR